MSREPVVSMNVDFSPQSQAAIANLTDAMMELVEQHLLSRPSQRDSVLEVLNVVAIIAAASLNATGPDERACALFDRMLQQNLESPYWPGGRQGPMS
jgi:hypothetical protein